MFIIFVQRSWDPLISVCKKIILHIMELRDFFKHGSEIMVLSRREGDKQQEKTSNHGCC
jgi:hypothetical protein